MKRSIDERGPIAAWLIRSRAQFREPNAQRTWTVDDFLAALKADMGWAPVRTTYARWESGATRPEPENLRRVEAFYAARGVGPEVPPAPTGDTETPADLIAALNAQTMAIKDLVALLAAADLLARVGALEPVVSRLAERVLGVPPERPVPLGTVE